MFVYTFTNRLDKKGRVSVPASFRAVLAREGTSDLYARATLNAPCLQCFGPNYFQKMQKILDGMDPFSPERDALAAVIFGDTAPIAIDPDGRIVLPTSLASAAGLKEDVAFVGKGDVFEIWEPEALQKHMQSARAAMAKKLGGK